MAMESQDTGAQHVAMHDDMAQIFHTLQQAPGALQALLQGCQGSASIGAMSSSGTELPPTNPALPPLNPWTSTEPMTPCLSEWQAVSPGIDSTMADPDLDGE